MTREGRAGVRPDTSRPHFRPAIADGPASLSRTSDTWRELVAALILPLALDLALDGGLWVVNHFALLDRSQRKHR